MVSDMSVVEHRKLVRDRLPQLIRSRGDEPVTRTLSDAEFTSALLAKLVEEAQELQAAADADRLPELADVWEVLTTLVASLGFSQDDVALAAQFTRTVRGGFGERVWLETTTQAAAAGGAPAGGPAAGVAAAQLVVG
jgi:predicted house-cleaning noncanonical NTP pyrophosphatase (MazG superfamily)